MHRHGRSSLSSPRRSEDSELLPQSLALAEGNKWRRRWTSVFPWLLSLGLLLLLLWEKAMSLTEASTCATYWKPYELEGAKREIKPTWKEVKFTGGLVVEGGKLFREQEPGQPVYVGAPTPEMDAAWDRLIQPLNLFVTPEEADIMGTHGMIVEPESELFIVMPQVLHDLHCLNFVRKALHIDHYPEEKNLTSLSVHTDHCIDALRQSLMCTGDMTVIRQYWSDQYHRILADFDNTHTCRDFEAIRQWSSGRNGQDDDVWPGVAARLKKENAS